MFSWDFVASVFRNPFVRLGALAYPLIGLYLVNYLGSEGGLGSSRLCALYDCELESEWWVELAEALDRYLPVLAYYSLLSISVSYYIFMIRCWQPIKDHIDLLGILRHFDKVDEAIAKAEFAKVVADQDFKDSIRLHKLISEVYQLKRIGVASVLSSIFLYSGVVGMVISSVTQVYVTSTYILLVEFGWTSDLSTTVDAS